MECLAGITHWAPYTYMLLATPGSAQQTCLLCLAATSGYFGSVAPSRGVPAEADESSAGSTASVYEAATQMLIGHYCGCRRYTQPLENFYTRTGTPSIDGWLLTEAMKNAEYNCSSQCGGSQFCGAGTIFGDIAGRGSVVGYPASLADTNV